MREIKFRGFSKYLCKWLYGDLEHVEQDHVRIWPLHASKDNRADDVSPESVGQYTGLKDSKGHEIYEGDIVENVNGFREAFGLVAKVKFNDRHCAFMLYYPGGDCIPMDAERQYEIVGNSYENQKTQRETIKKKGEKTYYLPDIDHKLLAAAKRASLDLSYALPKWRKAVKE